MKPSIWGRYFWIVIHFTALGYPEDPTQKDRDIYHSFYKNIGQVLPCPKCSRNYERHFQNLPIDLFLDSRSLLFKWTVQLHNIVNKELGKRQWSIEFAESYYKNFSEYNLTQNQGNLQGNYPKNGVNLQSILMISLNILVIIVLFLVLWVKYKQK